MRHLASEDSLITQTIAGPSTICHAGDDTFLLSIDSFGPAIATRRDSTNETTERVALDEVHKGDSAVTTASRCYSSPDPFGRESPGCEFCRKFGVVDPEPQWFDKELYDTADFNVVPVLGPLTVGSVMIVTRRHYRSMRLVPYNVYMSVVAVATAVRDYLRRQGQRMVIFEHGGGLRASGSCIDHAHLQLAPTSVDLVGDIFAENGTSRFLKLNSLADLHGAINGQHPYLLIQDQNGAAFVTDQLELSSQFMRRRLGALTNQRDSWDYLAFPNLDRVQMTLNLFADLPSFLETHL